MVKEEPLVITWENPKANEIGETAEEFLRILGRPSWLFFEGKDKHRSRVIVTLLHGNEPSGLRALHRWIKSSITPSVNFYVFIASVNAALAKPLFSHRYLANGKDLNRCFNQFDLEIGSCQHDSELAYEDKLAISLLNRISDIKPECIVDIHNTSGYGPSFGVAIMDSHEIDCLVSLFTDKLIITDIRLAALMEIAQPQLPVVTIECGGSQDAGSVEIAFNGITQLAQRSDIFQPPSEHKIQKSLHPLRLQIRPDYALAYGKEFDQASDLTLIEEIESYNSKPVSSTDILGWLGGAGLEALEAIDGGGVNRVSDAFVEKDGALYSKGNVQLFMATRRLDIARSDCLFYFVYS